MKITLDSARQFARSILAAQGVPADIADDVAEHLVEADRSATSVTACRSCRTTAVAIESGNVNPTAAPRACSTATC